MGWDGGGRTAHAGSWERRVRSGVCAKTGAARAAMRARREYCILTAFLLLKIERCSSNDWSVFWERLMAMKSKERKYNDSYFLNR